MKRRGFFTAMAGALGLAATKVEAKPKKKHEDIQSLEAVMEWSKQAIAEMEKQDVVLLEMAKELELLRDTIGGIKPC